MSQLHLWQDFYNTVFKMQQNLYIAAPPPQLKIVTLCISQQVLYHGSNLQSAPLLYWEINTVLWAHSNL